MKEKFKSVRVRLFFSLCIVVVVIVMFLIIINNVVLETFYLVSKTKSVKVAYDKINDYYNNRQNYIDIEDELNRISLKNDFDILIQNDQSILIFSSDKNFSATIDKINELIQNSQIKTNMVTNDAAKNDRVIYKEGNVVIRRIIDEKKFYELHLFISNIR